MKYLQSDNSKNTYGLYGEVIGPGYLVAIIEFESATDGDKLIRPIAAASALLAALEMVQKRLQEKPGGLVAFTGEEWTQIDAAIAEARGQ